MNVLAIHHRLRRLRCARGVRVRLAVAVALVVAGSCARTPARAPAAAERTPEFGTAFWQQWGDGRGELCGYELDFPRYGALRHGTAVTIFVTETFSNALRVKADPGRHLKHDEFPVLKLNLIQDVTTGIYDYNLMTSTFTALSAVNARPTGAPTKVSFSAQEWCGHVYAQVLFDARYARLQSHSYFDGEADTTFSLEMPGDAVSEDALLVWARGFATPVVAAGDSAARPMLSSLRRSRLLHIPIALMQATFTRAAAAERVFVPAGTFEANVATVRITGGLTWTFWIERDGARRVVQWACSDGERARLVAGERLEYWKLHDPGDESYRARLGLKP
jgi:hypothetical protein